MNRVIDRVRKGEELPCRATRDVKKNVWKEKGQKNNARKHNRREMLTIEDEPLQGAYGEG